MSDDGILSRAAEVVGRFPSRRVLVVGDIMLDEYVFGTVGRISPEAPVPVVAVTRETKVPGGAANVAFNLRGLGAGVEMAGLLGDDAGGRFVARMLKGKRVGTGAVVADPDRPTTVKTRVIAHSQQVVRVDREQKGPPSRKASDALLRKDAGRPRRGRWRRLLRLPEGGADRRAGPGGDRGGEPEGDLRRRRSEAVRFLLLPWLHGHHPEQGGGAGRPRGAGTRDRPRRLGGREGSPPGRPVEGGPHHARRGGDDAGRARP